MFPILRTGLPPEFANLASLYALGLENNQLAILPLAMLNLPALTWLNLENNQLSTLPPQVDGLSSLEYLMLSHNRLTSLPAEFGGLSSLFWLELNNNPLSGDLPGSLTGLTGLNRGWSVFTFYNTDWCVPASGPVSEWYAGIDIVEGTGRICGQPPGSLAGTVTAATTGSPLPGIRVTLRRSLGGLWGGGLDTWLTVDQALTDPAGSYRFDDLGQDVDYRVYFDDSTGVYAPQWYDGVADPFQSTSVYVTLGAVRTGVDAVMQLSP